MPSTAHTTHGVSPDSAATNGPKRGLCWPPIHACSSTFNHACGVPCGPGKSLYEQWQTRGSSLSAPQTLPLQKKNSLHGVTYDTSMHTCCDNHIFMYPCRSTFVALGDTITLLTKRQPERLLHAKSCSWSLLTVWGFAFRVNSGVGDIYSEK